MIRNGSSAYSFQSSSAVSSAATMAKRPVVASNGSEGETTAASSDLAQYDFSNMTKSQLLDAGKGLLKDGKISLDEMFQVQLASGEFNGTQSDATPHDFTKYFRDQLDGEISRGGLNDSKSMAKVYSHLLSVMSNRISVTA